MAGRSRVDITQLKNFQRNIDKLANTDIEAVSIAAIKELAREFLANVIQNTPVGFYTDGRVGGNLRRSWTTHQINVEKVGAMYQVEIINTAEYASYVNNGHRTRNGGFVNGRFFVEIAEEYVERKAPGILNKHINRALRGALNGN